MSDALQIANAMASKVSADANKIKPKKPVVEQMVDNADPQKRKAAADSMKKAFGG